MNKPLIIECNRMFPDEIIEAYRQDIMKQREEGIVVLPPGFKFVEVNVELLEEIKKEILGINYDTDFDYTGKHLVYQTKDMACSIIDKYIKELKGE